MSNIAQEAEKEQVMPGQGGTENAAEPARAKRTAMENAIAIRRHLKNGKQRKEIMALERLTPKAYRYALSLLGQYPTGNQEAFAQFYFGVQAHIEDVEADIERARTAGDLKVLPSYHRVLKDLRESIYEMAMKLGISKRAVEELQIVDRRIEVAFGDEANKPIWPKMPSQLM